MTPEDKSDLSFCLCSSIGKVIPPPPWLLSRFFFDFLTVNMICLGIAFGTYLAWCPLRFPNLVCHYFGKFLNIYCFKYYFCSFLSFVSSIPIIHISFIVVPQFLNILFFSVFFPFCFSILEVSSDIPQAQRCFFQLCQSNNEFIKGCFFSITMFLIWSISLFLEFPSLFTLTFSSCMLFISYSS